MSCPVPNSGLAPLEYRIALDVAVCLLEGQRITLVESRIPILDREAEQRMPPPGAAAVQAGLWIEPAVQDWRARLGGLSDQLATGAALLIVLSLPAARLLPERQAWGSDALGAGWCGPWRLRQALHAEGFRVEAWYGFHSAEAVLLNLASRTCEVARRPDLADRLARLARLRYCRAGLGSALTTVALVAAKKTG